MRGFRIGPRGLAFTFGRGPDGVALQEESALPRSKSLLWASVVLVACASVPGPGDAGYPYNVRGAFTGRLLVGDRPFQAMLSLRTGSGGDVDGTLRVVSPVEIDGRIRGRVIDDLLRITVTYEDAAGCEGRIEGILDVERGGDSVDGPVTVDDCGTPVAGRLALRRQR